jgi:hypothetical protein
VEPFRFRAFLDVRAGLRFANMAPNIPSFLAGGAT